MDCCGGGRRSRRRLRPGTPVGPALALPSRTGRRARDRFREPRHVSRWRDGGSGGARPNNRCAALALGPSREARPRRAAPQAVPEWGPPRGAGTRVAPRPEEVEAPTSAARLLMEDVRLPAPTLDL